jgi:hypothetical protein
MTFVLASVESDRCVVRRRRLREVISREGARRFLPGSLGQRVACREAFVAMVQSEQPAASDAMTSCIMLSSPWAALSIPSMPWGLV